MILLGEGDRGPPGLRLCPHNTISPLTTHLCPHNTISESCASHCLDLNKVLRNFLLLYAHVIFGFMNYNKKLENKAYIINLLITFTFTFTFMHLTDTFIQSDLQYIQVIHFLVSTCVPWESNPQPLRC